MMNVMKTAGGEPVWLEGEGVHLSEAAYLEVSHALTDKESPVGGGLKRTRLDSVIPGPPTKG